MKLKVIDLFCGAGGASTGVETARVAGRKIAEVVACVNHDEKAIESHSANHPKARHYIEDIRTLDVSKLPRSADFPNDILLLWASLECTNFSNAKGGKARDPDSRTLAEHLFRYIDHIKPDYLYIENVREFMSWGELDEHGKPISKLKGRDYLKWVQDVCDRGYRYEWRLLNSADYGAYTTRIRYFGVFAKTGLPIQFPTVTHAKKPHAYSGLFHRPLKKWNAVKTVLDLEDEGKSIFGRKKKLSAKTLERIYAGLVKYVAGGKDAFLLKYNSTNSNGKHVPPGLDDPCPVVAVQNRLGIVNTEFLSKFYGNGENVSSVDEPAGTVTTKDRLSLIKAIFIDQQYGQSKPASVESPACTITANPKLALVNNYFLMNQYSGGGSLGDIDNPCPVIVARQDKAPLSVVTTQHGDWYAIIVYEDDLEIDVKIKEFMALYGIIDIKMRMLKVSELLPIMGFPDGYILKGNQTEQKKFIGNAVEVNMAKKLIESCSCAINETVEAVA